MNGYGKYYSKTFTGSMYGAGPNVFAIWGYCVSTAMPPGGIVELNPMMLAPMIGISIKDVEKVIEYLCDTDKRSRTKDLDGRRLEHVDGFEYRLVNFKKYREGREDEARKEYFRNYKREYRARLAGGDTGENPDVEGDATHKILIKCPMMRGITYEQDLRARQCWPGLDYATVAKKAVERAELMTYIEHPALWWRKFMENEHRGRGKIGKIQGELEATKKRIQEARR